jgi:transcriptional regulator with GAF, ATPase, and Fis domain
MSDKDTLADVARSLFAEPTVALTLQRIVDLAAKSVDGCVGAGLLLVDKHEIVAGAWSNVLARDLETMEYEIGEGPCLDAIWERPTYESSDLRDQIVLWPTFAARAIEAGIESMLAFRLFVSNETLGALDLYGCRQGAFNEDARAFGSVFAAHAALALAGAQVHENDLAIAEGLRDALLTRDTIGQAKGILMATRRIDADAAFDLLRISSQDLNVKLQMVAERVIQAGTLPER